ISHKMLWLLIWDILLSLTLTASMPVIDTGSACKAMATCDPFLPICATATNEHQFFYSHCEMLRDICLTGKDWKSDYLSHCNVHKL
ncbi:hypothetical protein KR059_008973, partial [Drosophila kikkawai]